MKMFSVEKGVSAAKGGHLSGFFVPPAMKKTKESWRTVLTSEAEKPTFFCGEKDDDTKPMVGEERIVFLSRENSTSVKQCRTSVTEASSEA